MLSIIVLAALVKINLECDSPWVATGIFGIVTFVLSLMFGQPFLAIVIGTALNVGYGFVYFWLLKRTEQSGAWWPIMIVGILLFIGIGFL